MSIVPCDFDKRLRENIEYLEDLKKFSSEGRSIRAGQFLSLLVHLKEMLFSLSNCVLYPPKVQTYYGFLLNLIRYGKKNNLTHNIQLMQDKHFGIVPLEAMATQKRIIACNSSGSVETIKNSATLFGLLICVFYF